MRRASPLSLIVAALLGALALLHTCVLAAPTQQLVFNAGSSTPAAAPWHPAWSGRPTHIRDDDDDDDDDMWAKEEGVGHFSEWSKAQKRRFVDDVRAGKAKEWVVVMGNEGGDLDSMTAALAWAYHLSHISEHGNKTVALLQTPQDALDLRPENKLALRNVKMSPGHRDLLTIDELPLPPEELSQQLKGIVLVDHAVPLSIWSEAKILSILDHHRDRGYALDAKPRIFEYTASCTTIVSRVMLNELEQMKEEYHMPHEVVELILDAIALDSDGLQKGTPEDKFQAARLLKRSNWRGDKLLAVMEKLDGEMSKAKKDLDALGVRDLLRRDWKGDLAPTAEGKPTVHIGIASIPLSLDEQIERTLHNTTQSWFTIEDKWSMEIGADVSLSLHSFKRRLSPSSKVHVTKKVKEREVVLHVRSSDHFSEEDADSLFKHIKERIEASEFLDVEPWYKSGELEGRQTVWVHHVANGGRKLLRPLLEDAIASWK